MEEKLVELVEIIKLDKKDQRILYELDFEARLPFSQLAKRVGLSKQGVEYKVRNLMKKGVIKGFYPIVNVPKLGYIYCRFSFSFRNITQEKEKEILKYLQDNNRVFWLFTAQGYCDVLCALWARNVTEFREFVEGFLSRYGEYIGSKNESINTDTILYQNRFLVREKDTREINIKETTERVIIDKKDEEVLKELCVNARVPLVDIAKKVHLSAKVVAYRIRRMEKAGLIEGYRPIIDYNVLGFAYYKVWIALSNITSTRLKQLHEYVKRNPIVLYLVKGIGLPGELDIEVIVKSNIELYNFIKDLKLKFPLMVGEQKIFMFMETKKARFLPF